MQRYTIIYYLANGPVCYPSGEFETYGAAFRVASTNYTHNHRIDRFEIKGR